MKTFRLKNEEVKRTWILIDATDQIVGRLAIKVADILRGKNNPAYTPGVDSGDYCIIINCDKVKMSGKKETNKIYYRHSFYIGGLKKESYKHVMDTHPERIMEHAVNGMLPKNKLRENMMKRLKVYSGNSHPHSAQKLEELKLA